MTFGSKNRAMDVAGTRIIIFNGLLGFFCLFVWGEEKARQEQGWEGRTRLKRGLCEVTHCDSNSKIGEGSETTCFARVHQQGSIMDYGLVRKFEEHKQLKKITKLSPKPGSSAQLLWKSGQHFGYSNGFASQALLWFLSPKVIYIRNSNQVFTVCHSYYLKLDSTALSHSVSTNTAGKDEGLFLRSNNGTWPQTPHIPDYTVQTF